MARMREPRFKKCRSLGLNVCGHPKAMERSNDTKSRSDKKMSNYGRQLLEKQRLRAYYEVMEKQFKKYVKEAIDSSEISGDALVKSLEVRLDNLVYKMGFGSSIRQARQIVSHGHIRINGKRIDIPSYKVKVGDVISLKEKSQNNEMFIENFNNNNFNLPYIETDKNNLTAKLISIPDRKDIPVMIDDHLIIEYYSKLKM